MGNWSNLNYLSFFSRPCIALGTILISLLFLCPALEPDYYLPFSVLATLYLVTNSASPFKKVFLMLLELFSAKSQQGYVFLKPGKRD